MTQDNLIQTLPFKKRRFKRENLLKGIFSPDFQRTKSQVGIAALSENWRVWRARICTEPGSRRNLIRNSAWFRAVQLYLEELEGSFPCRHGFLQRKVRQTAVAQANRRHPSRALPIKIQKTLGSKISESDLFSAVLGHSLSIGRNGANFSYREGYRLSPPISPISEFEPPITQISRLAPASSQPFFGDLSDEIEHRPMDISPDIKALEVRKIFLVPGVNRLE